MPLAAWRQPIAGIFLYLNKVLAPETGNPDFGFGQLSVDFQGVDA